MQWPLTGSVHSQTLKSSLKWAVSKTKNCRPAPADTSGRPWSPPSQSFLLLEVVKWPIFSQWSRCLLRGGCTGTLCSFGRMGHVTGTALDEDSAMGGTVVSCDRQAWGKNPTQRTAEHKEWSWVLHAAIAELVNPHQQLSTPDCAAGH